MDSAQLLWFFAPRGYRTGLLHGRRVDVPAAGIYTEYVRAELAENGDLDALPYGASARQVARHFDHYGGHVIGLGLLWPRLQAASRTFDRARCEQ